jgi:hypothetical protein
VAANPEPSDKKSCWVPWLRAPCLPERSPTSYGGGASLPSLGVGCGLGFGFGFGGF